MVLLLGSGFLKLHFHCLASVAPRGHRLGSLLWRASINLVYLSDRLLRYLYHDWSYIHKVQKNEWKIFIFKAKAIKAEKRNVWKSAQIIWFSKNSSKHQHDRLNLYSSVIFINRIWSYEKNFWFANVKSLICIFEVAMTENMILVNQKFSKKNITWSFWSHFCRKICSRSDFLKLHFHCLISMTFKNHKLKNLFWKASINSNTQNLDVSIVWRNAKKTKRSKEKNSKLEKRKKTSSKKMRKNQKTIWIKNTICRVKNDDLLRIDRWKWSNNSIKVLRRTCMLFFWN